MSTVSVDVAARPLIVFLLAVSCSLRPDSPISNTIRNAAGTNGAAVSLDVRHGFSSERAVERDLVIVRNPRNGIVIWRTFDPNERAIHPVERFFTAEQYSNDTVVAAGDDRLVRMTTLGSLLMVEESRRTYRSMNAAENAIRAEIRNGSSASGIRERVSVVELSDKIDISKITRDSRGWLPGLAIKAIASTGPQWDLTLVDRGSGRSILIRLDDEYHIVNVGQVK